MAARFAAILASASVSRRARDAESDALPFAGRPVAFIASLLTASPPIAALAAAPFRPVFPFAAAFPCSAVASAYWQGGQPVTVAD